MVVVVVVREGDVDMDQVLVVVARLAREVAAEGVEELAKLAEEARGVAKLREVVAAAALVDCNTIASQCYPISVF